MWKDAAWRQDAAPGDADAHSRVHEDNRIWKRSRHQDKGHHNQHRPEVSPSRERGERAMGNQAKPGPEETSSADEKRSRTPRGQQAPPPPPRGASSHHKAPHEQAFRPAGGPPAPDPPVPQKRVKEEHPKQHQEKKIVCLTRIQGSQCGNWLDFKKLLRDGRLRCNRCGTHWKRHLTEQEKEEVEDAAQDRAEATIAALEREEREEAAAALEEERQAMQRRLGDTELHIQELFDRIRVVEQTMTTQIIGTPAQYLAAHARSEGMSRHSGSSRV